MNATTAALDRVSREAREAASALHAAPDAVRREAVLAMAAAVRTARDEIRAANQRDLDGLTDRSPAFRDR
ncbi:MAG TPA: gamma-glutamyl-phosphate reductase, partial [bacterium]|nr:gamma-glutamyl-phosphate reductase [bacterium]